jgi:isoleucyl-tRNA synthetase
VSAPWFPRRFGSELVRETLRRFLLTVWNTYSFFVTYARIDKFNPTERALPVERRSELDRWALSELNLLVERVDASLDKFDVTTATRAIEGFVEGLSNWYVRRSRRRFWKSEEDTDKVAAYLTLYECLATLAKLLAPFTPFLAEEMYQNLVRGVDKSAPLSVHLCDFPVSDGAAIDAALVSDVQLVRQVVSLGHAARNAGSLKVRQPLAKVIVKPKGDAGRAVVERLAVVITDELNVKALEVAAQADDLARYEIGLLPNLLGKKHGPLFPKLRAAVAAMPAASLARELQAGKSVMVAVDGQEIELLPDEAEVRIHSKEGYSVAEEGGLVVAVSTELSDALVREGLAREVVRRGQTQRKDAGFRIEDHIRLFYTAGTKLGEVFRDFAAYIQQETLTDELVEGEAPSGAFRQEHTLDGESLILGLLRIDG